LLRKRWRRRYRGAQGLGMAVAEEEVAAHGEEDSAGAAAAGMYHRE